VVFATLSETSTGIVHDVRAIAEVVRRHGALLVVDAVSVSARRGSSRTRGASTWSSPAPRRR
jgi:selenocysteine lyase/cysteine desulfurase